MEGVYYDAVGNLLGIVPDAVTIDLSKKYPTKSDVIDIIHFYGSKNQKLKACEELCELQEAILKDINKQIDSGVVEELADVYIMLAQLEVIYDIDDLDLIEMIAYKLNRQRERMKAGI